MFAEASGAFEGYWIAEDVCEIDLMEGRSVAVTEETNNKLI